jgi:hypothetical protein
LIVDKHIDLNIYKETSLLRQEEVGCATINASGPQLSKSFADIDFNEWVGESRMLCAFFLLLVKTAMLTRYAQVHSTFMLSSHSKGGNQFHEYLFVLATLCYI